MNNIFMQHIKRHSVFQWENLGDIREGRGELGENMRVEVYRLMYDSLLHTLRQNVGHSQARHYFLEAGRLAGYEYAHNCMDLNLEFGPFMAQLCENLLQLKLGRVWLEGFDEQSGEIWLTVAQDINCSGLEDADDTACRFEEGFLAGVFYAFTGEDHLFEETGHSGTGAPWHFYGRVMR